MVSQLLIKQEAACLDQWCPLHPGSSAFWFTSMISWILSLHVANTFLFADDTKCCQPIKTESDYCTGVCNLPKRLN